MRGRVPLLRISQRMYNFTKAVQKKVRSVQKIKSSKQKGEYWFPNAKISQVVSKLRAMFLKMLHRRILHNRPKNPGSTLLLHRNRAYLNILQTWGLSFGCFSPSFSHFRSIVRPLSQKFRQVLKDSELNYHQKNCP